jgi:ABC-2 type transport system ATP-binding protein
LLQGHLYGLAGVQLRSRCDELLDRFGLTDAADRSAKGYSGGMARRLDIAMALVNHPSVLFLDEPTTGLDPEVRAQMWSEIERLAGEHGITVLLTTHYLEEADQLASQLSIVDRGAVVASGTPEELKRELRGDAIEVELQVASNGAAHSALERIDGVREVVVDGRALRARADDGGRAVPAVLAALEAGGIGVAAVRVARPSLDDVYLRYTGRTFGSAQAQAEAQEQSQTQEVAR